MNRLHPLVESLPPFRRYRQAQVDADARAAEATAKYRAASDRHDEALAKYRAALDAGRAGPRPEFHAPVDPGVIQAELSRVRDGHREAVAQVADEAEPLLREREAELIAAAGRIVADDLRPIFDELELLVATVRATSGARGVPSAYAGVRDATLAELVQMADAGGGSFLPAGRHLARVPDLDTDAEPLRLASARRR